MEAAPLIVDGLRNAIVGPVSLTVRAGACAAIGGASGSGKSLLLRMIADLDPNEGDVRLGTLRRDAMAAPDWRRQVVYVPAEAGWWGADARAHVPPGAIDAATTCARRLGLAIDRFDRPIALLSTGERQRLALVRALVRRPKVLLLDEPSSALDPANVAALETVLRDAMAEGLVLVLVSHDEAQGLRLGTRRYAMHAGKLGPV